MNMRIVNSLTMSLLANNKDLNDTDTLYPEAMTLETRRSVDEGDLPMRGSAHQTRNISAECAKNRARQGSAQGAEEEQAMSLGSDVAVPKRRVAMASRSGGYRSGTKISFVLECGHSFSRPASRGVPRRTDCLSCWCIAVCEKHDHVGDPCTRCSEARKASRWWK